MPSSLTRVLSITLGFSPRLPVSVCGTGSLLLTRRFSWQCGVRYFGTITSLPITIHPYEKKHLTLSRTSCLGALFHQCAYLSLLRPSIVQTKQTGTGISTCCPSPIRIGFGLGPDLPWEDEPSPGNLSHSVHGILTRVSLLIPAFSLLSAPHVLTIMLQRP